MKISRTQKAGGAVVALCGAAAVGAIVFGGSHPAATTQIVVRPDAATGSVSTSTSSAAVAKPLAVVPRSSVVVKKPATIQGVTVTDPASTDPISPPATDSTTPVTAAPVSDPATEGPNGGPLPSMPPPVPPPTSAKPPLGPSISPSPSVTN